MRGDAFFRQMATQRPFSQLHPRVATFFGEYLSREKVVPFGDRHVISTHFPPLPSPAFDNLARNFERIGSVEDRRIHSVTLAVTNRCNYRCWHCYNAGRHEDDLPLADLRRVAEKLQDLGTVMVALSGGEPLLRDDLEEIARCFDESTCLTLNTTGDGLTPERAEALRESGVFAVGISLDSMVPAEHDRLRGVVGASDTALQALELVGAAGMYPYIVSVASHEFLEPDHFWRFVDFAARIGAREVHLLEPSATGRLAGRSEVLLRHADRERILQYQEEAAQRDDLPIVSSFAYLESPEAFGCGAGLSHLYIDGAGEVCPCQLVPLSFGNVTREPLNDILGRMACHFCKPRRRCVGRVLGPHVPEGRLPTEPAVSEELCARHLPRSHGVPRFFQVREEAVGEVGQAELQSAYDQIHGSYDEFWVVEARRPVEDLVARLCLTGSERVFEAGCGTGIGSVMLARQLDDAGQLTAVDLSEGMLVVARRRAREQGLDRIRFAAGDAVELLGSDGPFDLIFTTWVLGYIPLQRFFAAASRALRPGGRVALVVHRENSPREALEIFANLVAVDPSVLTKRVAFDFPHDAAHLEAEISASGLEVAQVLEGEISFRYASPEQVLEHLLKSGAGTAFYEAVEEGARAPLTQEFLRILGERRGPEEPFDVVHDYLACVATKPLESR